MASSFDDHTYGGDRNMNDWSVCADPQRTKIVQTLAWKYSLLNVDDISKCNYFQTKVGNWTEYFTDVAVHNLIDNLSHWFKKLIGTETDQAIS